VKTYGRSNNSREWTVTQLRQEHFPKKFDGSPGKSQSNPMTWTRGILVMAALGFAVIAMSAQ
jgi:hypothetical protein